MKATQESSHNPTTFQKYIIKIPSTNQKPPIITMTPLFVHPPLISFQWLKFSLTHQLKYVNPFSPQNPKTTLPHTPLYLTHLCPHLSFYNLIHRGLEFASSSHLIRMSDVFSQTSQIRVSYIISYLKTTIRVGTNHMVPINYPMGMASLSPILAMASLFHSNATSSLALDVNPYIVLQGYHLQVHVGSIYAQLALHFRRIPIEMEAMNLVRRFCTC